MRFKDFFKERIVHNEEFVSNGHFLIKKEVLTEKQKEFLNQHPIQDDRIQLLVKNYLKGKPLQEYIPTHCRECQGYFIQEIEGNLYGIDRKYYDFMTSRGCKIYHLEYKYFAPLGIFKDDELIGIVMQVKLDMENIEHNTITVEELRLKEDKIKEEKSKQPKGNILPVVGYYGIKRKHAYVLTSINGFDFWGLKEDDDIQFQDHRNILYLYDGHLFYVSTLATVKRTMEYRQDEFISYLNNFKKNLKKEFDLDLEKANNGQCNRINTGIAMYLDRVSDGEKARDNYNKIKEEKARQREIEKQKELEIKKQEEEKILLEVMEEFKAGELIKADYFLSLLEKFNIDLPLRTKGWAMKNLTLISKDSYRCFNSKSSVILDYAEKLYQAAM